MKILTAVGLWVLFAFAFLGVFGTRGLQAQGKPATEALPADINPDTLSRVSRPHRDDFATEDEKKAFDRVVATQASLKEGAHGPLGPTGIRAIVPEFGEEYRKLGRLVHSKNSLDPKMIELISCVAVREADAPNEWNGHAANGIKLLGRHTIEVIAWEEGTEGLDPKVALIINFARASFHTRRISSQMFADMEKSFGRKDTLDITLLMGYYLQNRLMYSVYDERKDPNSAEERADVPVWW